MIIPSQWRVEHQRPKRRALEIMLRSQWGEQSKKFRLAAAIAFSYDNFLICIKYGCGVSTESRIQDKSLFETGMNIMRNRHWLEYDFVSLVVLFAGIGFVALIVLGI